MKHTLSFTNWPRQRRVLSPTVIQTWHLRWYSLLACARAMAFAPVMGTRLPSLTSLPLAATCRSFLCCEQKKNKKKQKKNINKNKRGRKKRENEKGRMKGGEMKGEERIKGEQMR